MATSKFENHIIENIISHRTPYLSNALSLEAHRYIKNVPELKDPNKKQANKFILKTLSSNDTDSVLYKTLVILATYMNLKSEIERTQQLIAQTKVEESAAPTTEGIIATNVVSITKMAKQKQSEPTESQTKKEPEKRLDKEALQLKLDLLNNEIKELLKTLEALHKTTQDQLGKYNSAVTETQSKIEAHMKTMRKLLPESSGTRVTPTLEHLFKKHFALPTPTKNTDEHVNDRVNDFLKVFYPELLGPEMGKEIHEWIENEKQDQHQHNEQINPANPHIGPFTSNENANAFIQTHFQMKALMQSMYHIAFQTNSILNAYQTDREALTIQLSDMSDQIKILREETHKRSEELTDKTQSKQTTTPTPTMGKNQTSAEEEKKATTDQSPKPTSPGGGK